MKVLTLGAGKIGSAIAIELAKSCSVTSVDLNSSNLSRLKSLNPKINTLSEDATAITASMYKQFDLIISGVPGFLGYKVLENIINSERNVIDISFLPENHLELDSLAKSKGVVAIVDTGLAPGLTNLLCGNLTRTKGIDSVKMMVGGIPKCRKWPFQYKAPFSFIDVMEEYSRPARIKLFGNIVSKEPMSGVELIDSEVGSLEAFYTDGVRSMLYTLPEMPTIVEKTLRYPGYAEYINVLKYSGFFSDTPVNIKGTKITPFEFTSKILDKEFYFSPEEEDIVFLQIIGEGKEYIKYELTDRYCNDTKLSAMARTTGYPAIACAELIIQGKWNKPGIHFMEHLGKDEKSFQFIMDYLADHKIIIKKLTK